jgi:hypothetical protein
MDSIYFVGVYVVLVSYKYVYPLMSYNEVTLPGVAPGPIGSA